jgi:lipoprotein-releasing system ATP-binding protein
MGDEPTGNLDTKNTSIVLDIFKQLSQEFGQTIVAVTHDSDFARSSGRTIEMADGRIIDIHRN